MASIITGLKLTELSELSMGATGTKYYTVTSAGNSYYMTNNSLFRTLSGLYLNDTYQLKNEDWRFVHKTGTESITGIKTFYSSMIANGGGNISLDSNARTLYDSLASGSLEWDGRNLYDNLGNQSINWGFNKFLKDNNNTISVQWDDRIARDSSNLYSISWDDRQLLDVSQLSSLDWNNRYLISGFQNTLDWANRVAFNSLNETSLDWENKVLIGAWNIQQLRPIVFLLTGTAPTTATSAGISGQLARSGQYLYIATGTNKWGKIQILPF